MAEHSHNPLIVVYDFVYLLNSASFFSVILQSICGRMEIYPTEYRTGSNANEILISQPDNINLLPIYSPCSNDNQFFDGWGG